MKPEPGMMVTSSVKLVSPLGEGGMGSVWLAQHQSLHTQVVVKFIAAEFTNSPEALSRFSREAAAASQVKSPHVVQTLDHGVTPEGLPYIVMEFLEGRDLENHLSHVGRMAPVEVAEVVTQLSRALEKAHAVGIIHRDIKPANIFLCDAGDGALFVKLLDFGIAKGMNIPLLDSGTRTGSMIGSPFYMSPEQLIGAKDVDFHTDLWSVGVVAFESLTGRRAFDAETVGALALKIHNDPIPLPSQVNVDLANLDDWFARACAKKPEERFSSAKEMADSLAAAASGRRTHTSIAPPNSAGNGPHSRRSKAIVGEAKTVLDPTTDPRSRTDAGLGVQSQSVAPKKSRGLAIGITAVVALGVLTFVGVTRFKPGRATVDPDATAGSVHTTGILAGTGSASNSSPLSSSSSAASTASAINPPGTSSAPNAVGSVSPQTSASAPVAVSLPGAGGGRPIRPISSSRRPSQNSVPSTSSSAPKRPDDIY